MNRTSGFILASLLLIISLVSCKNLLSKSDLDPPVWPSQFTISIWETTPLNLSAHTSGLLYMNYPKNHFRIDRDTGRNQPLCQSILPNFTAQCTHLMNNGTKYVLFKTQNLCCKCCQIQDKNCGFYPQDWLKNSTYAGIRILSWQVYNQWKQTYNNNSYTYLESQDSERIPRLLTMANSSYSIDFFGTYNTNNIDDSVFAVPDYCTKRCPKSDFCTGGQKDAIFTNI